jgi:signal transduction histidine kinase
MELASSQKETKGGYTEMKRIQKIVLATVLVAVMLIASMPVIALAQDDEAHGSPGALLTRVAEILNIDQEELENAVKQAQTGLREEALENRLEELIDEGTLTQEQADAYKAWIEARPDIQMVPPRQLKEVLDKGIITQEVEELLEFSRLESGQITMVKESVDLKDLLQQCHEIFLMRAKEKTYS